MKQTKSEEFSAISAPQLQRLLQISTQLSSTLDLPQLLTLVLEVATELTNTETASILLLDSQTGELYFVAATNLVGMEQIQVPLEGSIAGWIVQSGETLVLDDVRADSRHFGGVDTEADFVTRTMLGVPLSAKGKVIGALEAINKKDTSPYTAQDIALLQALASQAAVAIENVRLFQQSDLISEIMHELKTPLMSINTASELLNRGVLSPEKSAKIISMIQRESSRLSKMTKSFLDLARLESGRAQMVRELLDLSAILNDVASIQESQATQRGITIHIDLPPSLPPLIGDNDQIKQVLINLTSNAVKYNRQDGHIYLGATLDESHISLYVRDTGPGISAENLKHLFKHFYRVPDSEGYAEGTGLGLAIARKIMEQHGGDIQVESVVDEGTTFWCLLPRTAK